MNDTTRPYTCRICGKPGLYHFVSTGDPGIDAWIEAVAQHMAVHDYCAPHPDPVKLTQSTQPELLPTHEPKRKNRTSGKKRPQTRRACEPHRAA